MRYFLLFLLVCWGAIASAQPKKPPLKKAKSVATQGLCGTVLEKKGNYMPGPDKPVPKGQPVVRDVLIYPLLNTDQVTMSDEGFITDVKGVTPVRTVKSDKKGQFCVYKLPAGRYSVLIREEKGLYGNMFDTQNHINPQVVQKGKVTRISLEITHQAAF